MLFPGFFFATLLLEMALAATWNRFYFSWGLPIYQCTIEVPEGFSWELPLATLQAGVERPFWSAVVFSAISDTRCGFRESYVSAFNFLRVPYVPVMRGAIVLDVPRRQIRVVGLCDWWVFVAVGLIFGPAALANASVIPITLVLFGGSYMLQRMRFEHVSKCVASMVGRRSS